MYFDQWSILKVRQWLSATDYSKKVEMQVHLEFNRGMVTDSIIGIKKCLTDSLNSFWNIKDMTDDRVFWK